MSALSCCDHSRVSTANNFCQDSELELERNSMGVLNLRLDSAIFCLVTTSQEGGMETRSAPVWLVNRAFALKFFVLCLNCIQIHLLFWLPVKSGAGCVYGDCPCLHSKVSEVKCISFWRRHIFLGFQYILGIMFAIWDSLLVRHLDNARHVDWFWVCWKSTFTWLIWSKWIQLGCDGWKLCFLGVADNYTK